MNFKNKVVVVTGGAHRKIKEEFYRKSKYDKYLVPIGFFLN